MLKCKANFLRELIKLIALVATNPKVLWLGKRHWLMKSEMKGATIDTTEMKKKKKK